MNSSRVDLMPLGDVAKRLGCEVWQIRRLFERGILPPAKRIGMYRVVPVKQLGEIRAELVKAGYLKK